MSKHLPSGNRPHPDWLFRPDGRTFNNLTIPDTEAASGELSKITGRALMRRAKDAGARFAVFDAKNQWYALHETTVSEKHPGLGKRDLVAELCAAGRALGVVYVPYVTADADRHAGDEYPDWLVRDASGQVKPRQDGVQVCCQVGPYRRYLCAYLEELAKNYAIGGVWFDGLGARLCYCDACRRQFRETTGLDLPGQRDQPSWKAIESLQGDWGSLPADVRRDWPVWVQWIEFRNRQTRQIVQDYADAIHRGRPGLPVIAISGFHGWPHGTADMGPGADLVPAESLWAWPTAQVQVYRAEAGYRPTESYLQNFQYAPTLPLSLPEQQSRLHALTSLASGGLPLMTLFGPPRPIARINRELRARAPWTLDAREAPYCGVVWSERSRNLHDRSDWGEPSLQSLYGTVKILIEEKIPECAVTDRQLEEPGGLDGFKVLVLPDIGLISPAAAEALRAFVRAGGGLVATLRASLADPATGDPLPDFALADVLGVHYAGTLAPVTRVAPFYGDRRAGLAAPNELRYKMLRFGDHPIIRDPLIQDAPAEEVLPAYRRGPPAGYDLAWPGPMLKVRVEAEAQAALFEGVQEPGAEWPMLVTRRYGRGRVVYLAGEPGRQHVDTVTWPYVRRLLGNAVRWAAGPARPPFKVKAPLHVQATLFRQERERRVVLHLLNDPAPKGLVPYRILAFQRHQEASLPVRDIEVALLGRFKRAYLVPGRTPLRMRFAGGYTWLSVPELHTHTMVVGVY